MVRVLLAILAFTVLAPSQAMSFVCGGDPKTFRQEAEESDVVLYGRVQECDDPNATDVVIDDVLKSHAAIEGKKVVRLQRKIAGGNKNDRYVMFGSVSDGKIDFHRGDVAPVEVLEYLKGSMAIPASDHVRMLRYSFDFLENPNRWIAVDAFITFKSAPEADAFKASREFPREKLVTWLANPKADLSRVGMYGFLLGGCGKASNAPLLRSVIVHAMREQYYSALDGLLVGYALLDGKEAWKFIRVLMAGSDTPFAIRFVAFKTARRLHATHPGTVAKVDLLDGLATMLDQPDFADFVVDTLREWKCPDLNTAIFEMIGKSGFHEKAYQSKAVIRYAIAFPKAPQSADYLEKQRKAHPEWVEKCEDLAKAETLAEVRNRAQ